MFRYPCYHCPKRQLFLLCVTESKAQRVHVDNCLVQGSLLAIVHAAQVFDQATTLRMPTKLGLERGIEVELK